MQTGAALRAEAGLNVKRCMAFGADHQMPLDAAGAIKICYNTSSSFTFSVSIAKVQDHAGRALIFMNT
jgi:hypothetical protein